MRDERYSLLRGYFRGADDADDDDHEQVRLQSVPVDARADAVGRSLEELGLYALGPKSRRFAGMVSAASNPIRKPLRASDIVVLRGLPEALALAESGCRAIGANRQPRPPEPRLV